MNLLYQDEHILVVNKPAGLLTIRDGYDLTLPTVKSKLEEVYAHCWIVHRLDKDTSGVLLVALDKETHRDLNLQFENRQIQKKYHAIVIGVPNEDHFLITSPLRVNGDRKHRTTVDGLLGKPAQSHVTIIQRFAEHALVQVEPKTGYTHQIRAHLSSIGYPILADPLYSRETDPYPFLIQRTALHAFEITFRHPKFNQLETIKAPYPDDFSVTLEYYLNKKAG